MNLQYQLSTGTWVPCGDRTDEFLALCIKNNGVDKTGAVVPRFRATRDLTMDEAVASLKSGQKLRNDPEDWYSVCRDGEATARPARDNMAPVEMVKCSCGHTVPRPLVMSASLGTSCADCYDKLSAI